MARDPNPLLNSPERLFTEIFRTNLWKGKESVSGSGSDSDQTTSLIRELPLLIRRFDINSLLDIACGDFHWMKKINLEGIDYTGADIVPEIIRRNLRLHQSPGIHFCTLNLMSDPLPKADLVLCRDTLVHFSHNDIFRALNRIASSGSTYLLATTFTGRKENQDIQTGDWRPLNLELPPFGFPPPLEILCEGCSENDGIYADKALGLWKLDALNNFPRCF